MKIQCPLFAIDQRPNLQFLSSLTGKNIATHLEHNWTQAGNISADSKVYIAVYLAPSEWQEFLWIYDHCRAESKVQAGHCLTNLYKSPYSYVG